MKFTSAALLFASIFDASAFAPSPALTQVTRTVVNPELFKFTPGARPSSELNLFGSRWRETRRINSLAKVKGTRITEKEVRALFEVWNSALATGDSRIVASRYTKNPVLLPTVSDEPRTDFDSVKDYFDSFLLKKPQGKIIDGKINIGDTWASDTGIYEFTMG
ncbi:hypothetical protein ACHAW6_000065, partial [Cyclotella cf. meneghiniana]